MKNLNKYLIYCIFIFTLILSTSCSERLSIDLKSAPKMLVVEGSVTDEFKYHYINLSATSDFFYNKPPQSVTNATITVTDGEIVYTYQEISPGKYLSKEKFKGEIGKHYSLVINNVDINEDGEKERYFAQSQMHSPLQLDSISVSFNDLTDVYPVKLNGKDVEIEKNNYIFLISQNDKLLSESIEQYTIYEDNLFNGKYLSNYVCHYLHPLLFRGIDIKEGDKITLTAWSVDYKYRTFLKQVRYEISRNIPGYTPDRANIDGNISNNGKGFFAAYSISNASVIYKKTKK